MPKADLRRHMGLVGSIRIDHVCYLDALAKLKLAMESVGSSACPICIHIIGATRTGKTTVIEDFLNQHHTTRVTEGSRQTVVYAKVPDKGTVKGLLENLLEALGDPHWHRGGREQHVTSVKRASPWCRLPDDYIGRIPAPLRQGASPSSTPNCGLGEGAGG